jgi:hypothetical protein
MSEKEKWKEKPKRNNRRFVGLSIFMILVLLGGIAWVFSILFEADMIFDGTASRLEPTHSGLILTHISGSATAAVSHATATAEAEQGQ